MLGGDQEQAEQKKRLDPAAETKTKGGGKGRELYQARCRICHGPEGAGDGPGARNLTPAPPDFRSEEWQSSIPDEELAEIISKGGAAVGKSAAMPGAPDLADEPAKIAALVDYVRSLEK